MTNLIDFKRIAKEKGACNTYLNKWDNCYSKKQLMDLALSAQGMDYLATSIKEGWGISSKYISDTFNNFINGKYIHEDDNGYNSIILCNYNGEYECNTTAMLILDSDTTIKIPENHICEIYVVDGSNINIVGEGDCIIVKYGENITINDFSNGVIKKIHK